MLYAVDREIDVLAVVFFFFFSQIWLFLSGFGVTVCWMMFLRCSVFDISALVVGCVFGILLGGVLVVGCHVFVVLTVVAAVLVANACCVDKVLVFVRDPSEVSWLCNSGGD